MNALFGQRQRLRRFASGMLLVWLFALTAGIVNACVVEPQLHQHTPVAAAPHQHEAVPGHHHDSSTGAGEPEDQAPGAGGTACGRFCDEPAASAAVFKQPASDLVHVLWLPAPLSQAWSGRTTVPRIPESEVRPWPPGSTVPIRIAFLRQAL